MLKYVFFFINFHPKIGDNFFWEMAKNQIYDLWFILLKFYQRLYSLYYYIYWNKTHTKLCKFK